MSIESVCLFAIFDSTVIRHACHVMTAIEKLLLRRTQLPGREKRHKHNRRKLVNNATKYRTLHYRHKLAAITYIYDTNIRDD